MSASRLSAIAARLPGYQPQAMPVAQAQAFLNTLAGELADQASAICPEENLPLPQTLGRVLARELISPVNVPPHDNAAMDGYAFHGTDLPGSAQGSGNAADTPAAVRLHVIGSALAGHPWHGPVAAGQCVRITTGAVMPAGLDTVVPHELVQIPGKPSDAQGSPESIELPPATLQALSPGAHRRRCGEDLRQGQPALHAGQVLNATALGLAASLGLPSLPVRPRLRVACFSTGDEVLPPGQPAREGAIYDSNRFSIGALLTRLGAQVIDMGAAPDRPDALRQVLQHAASQADAIITSGGASLGEADHTHRVMQSLGEAVFWQIAMRPGRPFVTGYLQPPPHSPARAPALLLGLPGNPVAAMVAFIVLARPALLRLMGAQPAPPLLLPACSLQALPKRPGRTEFARGVLAPQADGSLGVRLSGPQGSGQLSTMLPADALIVLPPHCGPIAPGDTVQVMPLQGLL